MFQDGQRVCFRNGGDPARVQKVQLAYGRDRARAPRVIPTNDLNATQVQVVTGEDAARYPFIDPIGFLGTPAAWYRADTGVTVTASGASMVADQADADNALVLPGVAGNWASAPDSVPLSIVSDIDIRVRVSMADWTPAAVSTFVAKYSGAPNNSWSRCPRMKRAMRGA